MRGEKRSLEPVWKRSEGAEKPGGLGKALPGAESVLPKFGEWR